MVTKIAVAAFFVCFTAAAATTTVTLASSTNPSAFGQSITLTASVAPATGSGKVTFYDSANILGIVPLVDGKASLTTGLLPAGEHSLTAYYAGTSSSVLTQLVGQSPVPANGFRPTGTYNISGFANQLAVADFNGDGVADLAVPGYISGAVNVLLGEGNGTFLAPVSYPTGSTATAIAAGDFNGDGKPDLAVGGGNTSVTILLGNGDGTFQPATTFGVAGRPALLALSDFNGDGYADLVTIDSGDFRVSILLGNGDGTFQPQITFAAGTASAIAVAVADFNGDGIADLAFSVGANKVNVLLGNGDATFQAPVSYTVGANPTFLVAGDFDGDGKVDLAVSQNGDGNIGVLLGNGDGTFQPSVSYVAGISPGPLAVVDFNADGKSDLVVADFVPGVASVLLGNGDGTFQAPLNFAAAPGALQSIAVGDFNADGRIDLAFNGTTFAVLLGETLPTTVTTLDVSPSPAYYNQPLTLTATVSPASATGMVAFFDGPSETGVANLSNGEAVIKPSLQTIGAHSLRVVYNGDAADAVSASPLVAVTVNLAPTTTTLSTSANPVAANAKLTLTATVTPAASGAVAFYQGNTLLGTAKLTNGQAGFAAQLPVPGAFSLIATYSGDQTHYSPSTSNAVAEVVTGMRTPGIVTLTSSANPSMFGQPVILTAAVSPATATGTVTFYDGTTILGAGPLVNGQAPLTTGVLASGARSLYAYYSGDANNAPGASATSSQTVNAAAVNTFRLAQSYPYSPSPISMVVADFNGDGKDDFAIAYQNNAMVSVFLSRGDGTFQSALNSVAGESPQSIVAGDFNGDGKTDLAVAGYSGVYTLFGNGDGTFQPPIYASSTSSYLSAAVGDFDRDGKADLVLSSGSSVSVLLGNGDGTFQVGVGYSLNNPAIALGDFNGDGYTDLAVASTSGVFLLTGRGDGTFQLPKNILTGSYSSIAAGDFNHDGHLDILSQGTTGLNVLPGNGDGTFQKPVTSTASAIATRPLAVGDFNGDGNLDVAGLDYFGFSVQFGNGDGTFQAGVNYASPGPAFLAASEFNGDGKADFAVAAGNSLNIFLGGFATSTTTTFTASPNPSNFGQPVTLTASVSPPSVSGAVAFYDGLTLLGAITLNNGQASLTTLSLPSGVRSLKAVYSGDGSNLGSTSAVLSQIVGPAPAPSNGFTTPTSYSAGLEPLSVAVGDFNGDGKPDVAVANFGGVDGGGSLSVLLGNGDGTFQPAVDYAAGSGVSAVAVGDINGDGKADLVAANYYDNTVGVLLGNGDGTFQPAVSFAAGKNPISVAIGDFNRDGYPDLAVSDFSQASTTVNVLLGNGDGTFQPKVSYAVSPGAFCVVAADLFGNGILDLAVGGYFGVNILQGNGDGTFASGGPAGSGVTYSIALGDFNGDGILDMATTNYNNGGIGVFPGTGTGSFYSMGYYPTGAYPRSLVAADFNGDGRLDLAVADFGAPTGGSLSVLSGNGDGTFQAPVNFPWSGNPTSLAAADFNADGQLDLIASSQNNRVSVLLGGLRPTPAVTLSSSQNPAKLNQPVVLTAAISPPDATGLVTFLDGTISLGSNLIANGQATLTTRFTTAMPHSITARYAGSGVYTASTSPALIQTASGALAPTVTTLSSTMNPSTYGQTVTLKASVNQPAATGTVIFYDGPNVLGSASLAGENASLAISLLASGTRSLKASYSGDANYAASTSAAFSQIVNPVPSSGLQSSGSYPTGKSPFAIAAGDFNGDGKGDLVIANSGDNTVSVLLGKGDGTFQPAVTYQTGAYPYSIAVGDFNGDGATDLAVANNGGNNVSVLLGNGDGTFQPATNMAAGNGPYSIAVGDFNRDGDLDLAVVNLLDNTVSILLGNGDGTFQAPVSYLAGNHPDSLAIADWNGDGIPDLLIADQVGGFVTLLTGAGDGTFRQGAGFGLGMASGPTSIVAGSFGFAVSNYGGSVPVVLMKGNAARNYAAGLNPWALALADINGDGLPDLIVANEGGNNVSVLTGNADGTFNAAVSYAAGNGPVAVVAADFNGDGVADLAVVNNLDSTVTVLAGSR